VAVTDIDDYEIQQDVFSTNGAVCSFDRAFEEYSRPCPRSFNAEVFSELHFGLSIALVVIIPIAVYCLMIFVTRDQSVRNRSARRTSAVYMKPSKSQQGRATDLKNAAFDNPLFTKTFHVIEVKGSEGKEHIIVRQNLYAKFFLGFAWSNPKTLSTTE